MHLSYYQLIIWSKLFCKLCATKENVAHVFWSEMNGRGGSVAESIQTHLDNRKYWDRWLARACQLESSDPLWQVSSFLKGNKGTWFHCVGFVISLVQVSGGVGSQLELQSKLCEVSKRD